MTDTVYVLDEYGLPQPKKETDMPPKTDKPKPKTQGKPKPARKGLPRWTESEVEMLMTAIKTSPSNLKAFEAVAAETGRSVGTIQQKYYGLKKKNMAAGGSVPNPVRGRSNASSALPGGVSSMDTDTLVALVTEAHAELRNRQEKLTAAMNQLGG